MSRRADRTEAMPMLERPGGPETPTSVSRRYTTIGNLAPYTIA